MFSDEEGEASGRSEGEEEEGVATGGYFPPAPAFPPAPFPAPPAPPHAPLLSPPAQAVPPAPAAQPPAPAPAAPVPHLNGHPPQHDDHTRHLVAALQGESISQLYC